MEKRHNYVRKVAETATQLFITNDKANCSGLLREFRIKPVGSVYASFFMITNASPYSFASVWLKNVGLAKLKNQAAPRDDNSF